MTFYGRAIALLVDRPELAEVAAYPFGFDVAGAAHGAAVRLASGAPLEAVAGDGTGGTFFVCGGGPVLYASGDGAAGLVAASADEALEMAIGLPGWLGLLHLSPAGAEAGLPAAVTASEEAIRESQPDLDARRAALRGALGLPVHSPAELFARLHAALLRTEPDHLLLDTAGGRARARLDPHPRTPLRETVLSPGLADLARLRDDTAQWTEVAGDKARRATVLRAAQFDRQEHDLPLLRRLLAAETADAGTSEELRLAAVLVALHGSAEDLPLLRAAHAAPQAVRWGLPEVPEQPGAVVEWARGLDGSYLGEDPAREPELTWIRLARRQGRTELARAALLRILDSAEEAATAEQADLLRVLSVELEALGDLGQAARAQSGHAALVDEPRDRGWRAAGSPSSSGAPVICRRPGGLCGRPRRSSTRTVPSFGGGGWAWDGWSPPSTSSSPGRPPGRGSRRSPWSRWPSPGNCTPEWASPPSGASACWPRRRSGPWPGSSSTVRQPVAAPFSGPGFDGPGFSCPGFGSPDIGGPDIGSPDIGSPDIGGRHASVPAAGASRVRDAAPGSGFPLPAPPPARCRLVRRWCRPA